MPATAHDITYRTITDLDQVRISNGLRRQFGDRPTPAAEALADVVDSADVLRPQEIGADVVTMGTRLRLLEAGGAARVVELSYPEGADLAAGKLSVLSPMGTALLGRRVGDRAEWQGADAQPAHATIEAIEFQPEASGDYTA